MEKMGWEGSVGLTTLENIRSTQCQKLCIVMRFHT